MAGNFPVLSSCRNRCLNYIYIPAFVLGSYRRCQEKDDLVPVAFRTFDRHPIFDELWEWHGAVRNAVFPRLYTVFMAADVLWSYQKRLPQTLDESLDCALFRR